MSAVFDGGGGLLINIGVGQVEGVGDVGDGGLMGGGGDEDFDDVEAEGEIGEVQEAEPGEGALDDAALLVGGDGAEGASEVEARACFYFDKNEGFFFSVAANEVDFASIVSAKIAVEDFEAFSAQGFFG